MYSRNYKYITEIHFEKTDLEFSHQISSPYPFSKSYKDNITIAPDKVTIESCRSNKVNVDGIFLNHQSAIYRQVTKSLVFYYCLAKKSVEIKYITVSHPKKNGENEVQKFDKINQITTPKSDLSILSNINLQNLEYIFEEDSKGHSLLFAITHLIKSLTIKNNYDRFERKWKSFNALYKCYSGKTSDHDGMKFIRNDMCRNNGYYPLIESQVDNLTPDEVRNKLRWIKLIHNDFSNKNMTTAFSEFIKRNKDKRLMYTFEEILPVRVDFLKELNLYDDVVNHINNHKNSKNNMHLAATLCIKYMYFVRNKSIHAEKVDSGFRIIPMNKEDKEVKWLSTLLSFLIMDLINSSHRF